MHTKHYNYGTTLSFSIHVCVCVCVCVCVTVLAQYMLTWGQFLSQSVGRNSNTQIDIGRGTDR